MSGLAARGLCCWMLTAACWDRRLPRILPLRHLRKLARLIELTANPALTNFTLPKIWWVQKNEPEIWARADTILLPKDYVRLRLSGSRATDVTDASGTLLFDVANPV